MAAAEPQNPFACEGLGEAYRMLGQLQLAVVAFARAHELRPGDAYMARRNAEAFLTMDDVSSARRWLEEARKRRPRTVHTQIAAFTIALVERDEETQLALIRRVLGADPGSVIGLNALGQSQLRAGQLDAAEPTLKRVLDLRGDQPDGPLLPSSIGPAIGLAAVYRGRGDAERLSPWLARLGTIRDAMRTEAPDASDACLLAARIASLQGDRKLMLDELRTAVRQGFRQHWSLLADPAFMHWHDDPQLTEFVAGLEKQNVALRAELVATNAGQALVASR